VPDYHEHELLDLRQYLELHEQDATVTAKAVDAVIDALRVVRRNSSGRLS
jgi:hypothetical protein